jgi:hypothetical protein
LPAGKQTDIIGPSAEQAHERFSLRYQAETYLYLPLRLERLFGLMYMYMSGLRRRWHDGGVGLIRQKDLAGIFSAKYRPIRSSVTSWCPKYG